jgi:ATP-dependent Lhr-like helicase
MGTITSDPVITVQYVRGAKLGTVEENFVSKLKKGAVFNFAGKTLKYVMLKDLKLYVKKASANEAVTPVWQGGKLPLSDLLTFELRDLLEDLHRGELKHELLSLLAPVIEAQERLSVFPKKDELLIETCETREGHHTFLYPFSGRLVHEGLAALMSMRLSKKLKETFSFSVNEYGLEILGPSGLVLTEQDIRQALGSEKLIVDMEKSLSSSGLAKRQFKEIAQVSGLVPQNQAVKRRTLKNLQSSTSLLFDVFERYEVQNLLYQQSLQEVKIYQFQEERMKKTLQRLEKSHLIYRLTPYPGPLAFPLVIERMAATVSGNSLKERIEKLKKAYQAQSS